ncbi:MAG: dTDP-glucose 4,6-dehydratase [Chlamydiota bacterium]|nr:dTDP-glucose 4,6-dehydratase [Chlamydiota bacterium]
MKILVTGGAGFIGSNFIRYCLKNIHEVKALVNVDKLTYAGNLDNLKDVEKDPRYSFVHADIANEKKMEEVFSKGIDVVFNFAAETHVDRSIDDPAAFITTDVYGTYVLLEQSRKGNIKKFVQVSTDEVYGSIEKGSFKETDPLMPGNPYSASKAGADRLAFSYWATYQMPIVITRASNNFGSNQYPEKYLPLMITNLLEDKDVPIYGDGKNIRDWLYVNDHCSGLWFVMKSGIDGQVYNIGGQNERQNIDVAHFIVEYMGKAKSRLKFVKDRLGHDRRYSLDISKIKTLGWSPSNNFEELMKQTVDWYIHNPDWWRKIKSGDYLEYYKKQYEKR